MTTISDWLEPLRLAQSPQHSEAVRDRVERILLGRSRPGPLPSTEVAAEPHA